jgi:tetratricopeptide (TPR) repeat protein
MYKMPTTCKRGATMMKSSLIRINLIFILLVLFIPNLASAKTKTFIKEYTYQASEADSKISSRAVALEQVKRLLLEEIGTYIESHTEVINFQLTKDQITALTAGIVQTQILKEKWDGERYWIQAKIEADPAEVAKDIDALRKDREKSKELEDANRKAETALKEVERLRKELELSKEDRTNIAKYDVAIKALSATDWYLKGISLVRARNYDEAIAAFTKAIQLNPKYSSAYANRSAAYGTLRDHQQALADSNKAIELDPKDAVAYVNRGSAHAGLKNYKQAIEDADRAIQLDPKLGIAYYNRARSYIMLGNWQQAIKDSNKAIELYPTYSSAYLNRGVAYLYLGDFQQAIIDFNKAIELDPRNLDAYNDRGTAYINSGYKERAISDYKTAARLGHKGAQDYLRSKGISW